MNRKSLSNICKKKIIAKYKDGHWYEAKVVNVYHYNKNKNTTYYLEWLDGTKNDRIKTDNKVQFIPKNTEYGVGIDYILLASLLC